MMTCKMKMRMTTLILPRKCLNPSHLFAEKAGRLLCWCNMIYHDFNFDHLQTSLLILGPVSYAGWHSSRWKRSTPPASRRLWQGCVCPCENANEWQGALSKPFECVAPSFRFHHWEFLEQGQQHPSHCSTAIRPRKGTGAEEIVHGHQQRFSPFASKRCLLQNSFGFIPA